MLLLDRARFPRYKTCGGGIVGTSLEWMPGAARATVTRDIRQVRFTRRGRAPIEVHAGAPFLGMVDRERFDQALVDAAVAAGAEFRDGCTVRGLDERDDRVEVRTGAETLVARVVVGADGTGGRTAAHVGVRLSTVDLGLEDEREAEAPADEVLLDWGPLPGSYAWLFPKTDEHGRRVAVVGVIARRGSPDATRAYLSEWSARLGLADAPLRRGSGHLTRVRERDSPLVRGRTLLAGDAAGLLEPWTREGISYALRSGCWAGEAAARGASGDPVALDGYGRRVHDELTPERDAGMAVLRMFERAPWLAHAALRTGPGRRFFVRFCLGRTRLSRLLGHRAVRLVLRSLG